MTLIKAIIWEGILRRLDDSESINQALLALKILFSLISYHNFLHQTLSILQGRTPVLTSNLHPCLDLCFSLIG